MTTGNEDWMPISGYEGLYEVSNTGQVRSLDRTSFVPTSQGGYHRAISGKTLQPEITYSGHARVLLSKNGKAISHAIHRLVATEFIPNPRGLPLVLHGPAGVSDNSVENLRWGTNSDNMRDRKRDGTCRNTNKTHCPQGHEYNASNTQFRKNGGGRQCLTCIRDRSQKWRESVKTRLGSTATEEVLRLNQENRPTFWIARELNLRERDVSRLLSVCGKKSLRVASQRKYDTWNWMVQEGYSRQEICRTTRSDARTLERWFPGSAWLPGGGKDAQSIRQVNQDLERIDKYGHMSTRQHRE